MAVPEHRVRCRLQPAQVSRKGRPSGNSVGDGARLHRARALPDGRGQVAAAQLQRLQRMEGRQHHPRGVPAGHSAGASRQQSRPR